jgi:hypothetical protein
VQDLQLPYYNIDFHNQLALSINLFENFKNKDELAFFIANKIIAYNNKINSIKEIEKNIKAFLNDLIKEKNLLINFENYIDLLKDLEKSKNYNEFIILNPYFFKHHNSKYQGLIKKLKEISYLERCKYITEALLIIKNSGFDVKNISEYDLENFRIINLLVFF